MTNPKRSAVLALSLCALAAQAQTLNPAHTSVQMFQWAWNDVATECTQWLGPKGFGAVQISPAHASKRANGWWGVYQPVNYASLSSRFGNRTQLQAMVSACHAAGVRVYADIVVNQMADGSSAAHGLATDGSSWDSATLTYPRFSGADFHANCLIQGSDYSSPAGANNVRNCRMGGLPDLATESSYVQGEIVNHMTDLLSLGIDGFRIDAAKHMPVAALQSILNAVRARQPRTQLGEPIWITQEIIPDGAINRDDYLGIGTLNEFKYSYLMRDALRGANGQSLSSISAAMGSWGAWGGSWGFVQPQSATVFLNNWDTERHSGDSLNASNEVAGETNDSRGTKRYELGAIFMLAQGYGEAQLHSGFRFSDRNADRPSESPYLNGQPQINVRWDFIHRWRGIANMVAWRNASAGLAPANWTQGNAQQVAFSRGNASFVALNNSGSAWSRSFQTGLSAGRYCNVINGEKNAAGDACSGDHVDVDASGTATLSLPADGGSAVPAVALHRGQKLSAPPVGGCAVSFVIANAATVWGENLHVTGNQSVLANWNAASAPPMAIQGSGANAPWRVTLSLPANTWVQYKYIKKNGGAVRWESNQATSSGNREFMTCAAGAAMTRDDGSFRF